MQIKINRDRVREMRQAFNKGTEDLTATRAQITRIVELLQGGGLVGIGGSALSDALGTTLIAKLNQILEKFEEMVIDLQAAEDAFVNEDKAAAMEQGM